MPRVRASESLKRKESIISHCRPDTSRNQKRTSRELKDNVRGNNPTKFMEFIGVEGSRWPVNQESNRQATTDEVRVTFENSRSDLAACFIAKVSP